MIVDKNIVQTISKLNNEPEWLLKSRIEALSNSEGTLLKSSRRLDYSNFNLENYNIINNGEIHFNKKYLDGKISSSIYEITKRSSLIQIGKTFVSNFTAKDIIFKDIKTLLQENPSIFEKHFMNFFNNSQKDKLELFNYALWQNGYFLYVPENTEVEIPIQNIFILNTDGKAIFLNNFIVLEKRSKVTFIDSQLSYQTKEASLVNNMLNVFIADDAQLDYISIQEYDKNVNSINNKNFFLQKDSRANWFEVVFGGKATKNSLEANLYHSGAEVYMQGLYFAGKDQQMEFNTAQMHHVGYTKSDLLYTGALRDNAITSYEGMIRVNQGAQKTDAYQKNKNLILSREAHADSEPLLEILANDVRCTHGATVGPVDPEDLFYLMSRGLEEEIAKKLLISGFFSEVIQKIPVSEIKDGIQLHIEENI